MPRIRRNFVAERGAARSGVYTASENALRFHGPEAGPAYHGAPFVSQHLCILLEVGRHYVKIETGPGSCVGLEGGDA